MEEALLNKDYDLSDPALASHLEWLKELSEKYNDINKDNVRGIIEQEIGKVFSEVLEDAGVYKRNAEGKEAFLRFISSL